MRTLSHFFFPGRINCLDHHSTVSQNIQCLFAVLTPGMKQKPLLEVFPPDLAWDLFSTLCFVALHAVSSCSLGEPRVCPARGMEHMQCGLFCRFQSDSSFCFSLVPDWYRAPIAGYQPGDRCSSISHGTAQCTRCLCHLQQGMGCICLQLTP